MFKIRTVMLFGVVLILAIGLATAAFFKTTTSAASPSIAAANPEAGSAALAQNSANPNAAYSPTMSEYTIRRMLDEAYNRHWDANGQLLLSFLNGRYERRCCGLPW
jgi:hypothetical protein